SSNFKELDEFLEGGLPVGRVSEWGMPLGQGGRSLLISWLARLKDQPLILWCSSHKQMQVYPPAWVSRGVALERVRFAVSAKPLAELRPVFMEPLFPIIILDCPRGFTEDDCAFLARRA